MIQIANLRPSSGRVAATFTAIVHGLALSGCALIWRDEGFTLSVPRVGSPSRPAPLSPDELSALENAAVDSLRLS